MMRLDYVRQQRQWQAEQARAAPTYFYEELNEDEEVGEEEYFGGEEEVVLFSNNSTQNSSSRVMDMQLPQSSFGAFVDGEDEVDQVLQMEDQELEALLEHLPVQQRQQRQDDEMEAQSQWSTEHFGSDDEDYDVIFAEMLGQSSAMANGGEQSDAAPRDADEMDES
jgi:hypothetical protein